MMKHQARSQNSAGRFALALAAGVVIAGCQSMSQSAAPTLDPDNTVYKRMVTQGPAKTIVENLYKCPVKVGNHRVSAVGQITAEDGTVITVPAETALQKGLGPKSTDLYNECTQITPKSSAEISASAPVVEIDSDGEVITGYVVADNYYEMWVNGKLVSVDNTPYTPFNSSIVKFKVKRPYTLAFLLVDWDEHMGLGMELFPISGPKQDPWYPGDGGLVARFSDGTVTDSSWKAQSFYIAPLTDPKEVVERGNIHEVYRLGRVHPFAKKPTCENKCFAVHYPIPANWQSQRFNDTNWPRAWEYTDDDVGVDNLPAYTRYRDLFAGARWIWTINLVFDNAVIARKTVH